MKNLSVIIASLDDTSPDRRGIGSPVRFPSNFNQSQQNDTSLPRAPLPGKTPPAGGGGTQVPKGERLARQRLRGWTKDTFRLSGITQVLLCTTSPTSSLRSMPPPLVGEALAFRDVFRQTQISFIENETSLPRAPLLGKTPPAGGGGTQVPKEERLASGCETERFTRYIYSERSQACRP